MGSHIKKAKKVDCHGCGEEVLVDNAPMFSTVQCPSCETELPVPGLLGEYVLIAEMGSGAMGTVYQAFDQNLQRYVAIKLMHAHVGEDPNFMDNFLREARALAALNHANVAQIYTLGKEEGQPYIVMELIEGGRLDDMMKEQGPMEEHYILKVIHDVARGLDAAQEIGLIHGDVKPENILFDQRGQAKVVDFGLARRAQKGGVTQVWGTPNYIAPEKARKEKDDHRSDIYSLGATMFYALAGTPPFEGETPRDVILARLQHEAPSLAEFREDLSEKTVNIVARMLEMEPIKRYPNYQSLMADLAPPSASQQLKPIPGRPGSRRSTTMRGTGGRRPAPKKSGSSGRAVFWIILALTLLGGGGWAGWKYYEQRQESRNQKPAPAKPTGPKKVKFVNGELGELFAFHNDGPSMY
ncbi:MAG: serine/threonine-protein kinase, partial [Verrucomicrobiota bacterium]